MRVKRPDMGDSKKLLEPDRELLIQVLSLEYQTLREEVLVRTSGRFQFLGLMTTAAALLSSGILGPSIFGHQTWIAALLAAGVLAFGLVCFVALGRLRTDAAVRVAEIEKRINAMLPAERGFSTVLSWESGREKRTFGQKLMITAGLPVGSNHKSSMSRSRRARSRR